MFLRVSISFTLFLPIIFSSCTQKDSEWAIPPKYDEVEDFEGNVARVKIGKKWALIDKDGNQLTSFKYDEIIPFCGSLNMVRINNKFGLINQRGEEVTSVKYQGKGFYCYDFFNKKITNITIRNKNFKYLISDNKLIPIKYDIAVAFPKQGLAIAKYKRKWGILDKSLKEVVPMQYDSIGFFSKDFAYVKVGSKVGLINKKGKVVIPIKYDEIFSFLSWKGEDFSGIYFIENLLSVKLKGKWGCIDKKGKIVIPFKYDDCLFFTNRISSAGLNGKFGCINQDNEIVIPIKYDDLEYFFNGLINLKKNGKWGVFDTKNKTILFQPKFDDIIYTGVAEDLGRLMAFKLNKKWAFFDTKRRKVVSSYQYDSIVWFEDLYRGFELGIDANLVAVSNNGKWGVVNTKNQIICPIQYERIDFLSRNVIVVYQNEKVGIVNSKGKQITPIKYDRVVHYADDFIVGKYYTTGKYNPISNYEFIDINKPKTHILNGVIPKAFYQKEEDGYKQWVINASYNGKRGCINKEGKEIIPIKYDDVTVFNKGLVAIKLNGKWGYANREGKEVIPLKYEEAGSFSSGVAAVKLNGKWGYIPHPAP